MYLLLAKERVYIEEVKFKYYLAKSAQIHSQSTDTF